MLCADTFTQIIKQKNMDKNNFCQSCSMPLDTPEAHGTEKDGSPNAEYCRYCYQNGSFTNPNMTLVDMRSVVKTEMERRHISPGIIDSAMNILPNLKRWAH